MRQKEAGDVGEARVDVFPDVLQLLVLVLLHLKKRWAFQILGQTASEKEKRHSSGQTSWKANLQPLLQEVEASLQAIGVFIGVTPVPDQEHQSLRWRKKNRSVGNWIWKLVGNTLNI